MRSAFALRINSGKNILMFATLENLRIFQSCFFTEGNITRSAALSQKAALQMLLPFTTPPVKRGFRNARRRF